MTTKRTNKQKQEQLKKLIEKEKQYQIKYYEETFKDCHPQALELAKKVYSIYENAMLIVQDCPDEYAKQAAICFFGFACGLFEDRLKTLLSNKDAKPLEIKPADKVSDYINDVLNEIKKDCSELGYTLVKKLLVEDFALFLAILKALDFQNTLLHNLLVSHFKMFTWLLVYHIKQSERKENTNDTTTTENENN